MVSRGSDTRFSHGILFQRTIFLENLNKLSRPSYAQRQTTNYKLNVISWNYDDDDE